MTQIAGRTVSIRVPHGLPEKLKAATGVPFSTLVRLTMQAYADRLEREQRTGQSFPEKVKQADQEIREIVEQQDIGDQA